MLNAEPDGLERSAVVDSFGPTITAVPAEYGPWDTSRVSTGRGIQAEWGGR